MIENQMIYIVARSLDGHGLVDEPFSSIPTLSLPATAVDQYETVAVLGNKLPGIGAAFTDVGAMVALAKIAEGNITSHRDLEAAETALQALLLHERVHVLTYAPKVEFNDEIISYSRQDEGRRSDFAFQLTRLAGGHDFIIAPELVRVQAGKVISSTSKKSPLIGRCANQLSQGNPYWSNDVEDAINAAIDMHGIPAYLTEDAMIRRRLGEGFAKDFYRRMRLPWDDAVSLTPPVICTFSLPPLLSIVLDRSNNRADLSSVIAELREELINVRKELRDFNQLATASTTQTEANARIARITESFDAVVPESLKTDTERRRRMVFSINKIINPILTIATTFAASNGINFEKASKAVGGALDLLERSDSIVDRTVTSRTFSGLLRETETLQSLIDYHFSRSEIYAIEKSMRNDHK